MLPVDIVGEGRGYVDDSTNEPPSGLSDRGMRTAIEDLLTRGLVSNKWIDEQVDKGRSREKALQGEAAAGEEWYCWRLCPDTWANDTVPRKPAKSAGSASGATAKNDVVENKDTSDDTRGSTIPRVAWAPPKIRGGSKPVRLRPGAVEQTGVLVVRDFEVPTRHRYSGPPDTSATITRVLDEEGLSFDVEFEDHRKPAAASQPSPPLVSQPRGASSPPQKNSRPLTINLANFPEASAFIVRHFPSSTDDTFLARLFGDCINQFIQAGRPADLVTDELFLKALEAVTTPEQRKAGLYLFRNNNGDPGTLILYFRQMAKEYARTGSLKPAAASSGKQETYFERAYREEIAKRKKEPHG